MRLQGAPPDSELAISYLDKPTGAVVGFISGPQGPQGPPGPVTEAELEWGLRAGGLQSTPAGRLTFFDKPDAATTELPTTADTGQSMLYTTEVGGVPSELIISGGRLKCTGGGTSVAAGYAYIQGVTYLTRIGMRFSFSESAAAVGAALGIAFLNTVGIFGNTNIGMHLVILRNYMSVQKYINGTWTTIGGEWYFVAPLKNDGTIYSVDVYRVGNSLTIIGPDGSIHEITDPDVSANAEYAFVEPYLNNPQTESAPEIAELWFDEGTQNPPSSSVVTRELVDNIAATKANLATTVFGFNNGVYQPLTLWCGTQTQYDAIVTKDPNAVYVVT